MLDKINRENFLAHIASQLGREVQYEVKAPFKSDNQLPQQRLSELTMAQRWQSFYDYATTALQVDCQLASPQDVAEKLLLLCEKYGGGQIIINDNPRLQAYGLTDKVCQHYSHHIWSPEQEECNRSFAEKANIGICFAEYGLVESGGVVLFSSATAGRSTSLLPKVSIIVLNKSSLLLRVSHLAKVLHEKAQLGVRMPSCINLIAGPSSTADIELIKVIGVHGPTSQVYLVVDDMQNNS